MRVLFIAGEFPPMQGGLGDCTNEIARALAALGVQVCVLTSVQAGRGEQSLAPTRDVVVRSSVKQWNWSSLRVLRNTIREFVPDIVHIQYQTAAYGMHPAINFAPRALIRYSFLPRTYGGERRRVRVAVTFHDLRVPYLFPKVGRVREWVTRELARSSDAVIVTNDEDYLKLEIWNLKRLSLVPIGSNITTVPPPNYQRAAWRAQYGIGGNETLLCYFGFLNESKGGEMLIRALAEITQASLLMIGGQTGASDPTNAAYLAKVKALIKELGLTSRVLWADYMPSEIVTANFLASDICVLPYRDGASYRRGTLMAALAHGMPIVTTTPRAAGAVHGLRSVPVGSPLPTLRDGENCLLVPPDDPRALAEAIRRAAASPDLRRRIGAGARELAQHFTWDKIAQQHLELYGNLEDKN